MKKVSDIGEITEQRLIRTSKQLDDLGIIDWDRERDPQIRKALYSWVVGLMVATIFKTDLTQAPARNDMPKWGHQFPAHQELGRLYWNWFHWAQKGELWLDDQPDFGGQFASGKRFYGDFGEVSPMTFAIIQRQLERGQLWISVLDAHTQVILAPVVDIVDLWNAEQTRMEQRYIQKISGPAQLSLF